MELIVILAIVFGSIMLLIWKMTNLFKGKGSCIGCGSHRECSKNKDSFVNCMFPK